MHFPRLAAGKHDKPAVHELVDNVPHDVKIEQAWIGEGTLTLPVVHGEEQSDLAPVHCGKGIRASQAYIVNLVLRETAFLSIVGIVIGVGATLLLKKAMDIRFPSIPFPVDPHWIINATLIALAGALIGALYPALKAARKDPIEALAYE